jgi:tetratricopeptide (TPR) repeat protein
MTSRRYKSPRCSFRLCCGGVIPSALLAVILFALPGRAAPQRYTPKADPESQEGQLIELIGFEVDEASKLSLMERFTRTYPKHPACAWAYEHLQLAALEAHDWDKAIANGEKLLAIYPDDTDTAQLNLKAAEGKGDRVTLKLWSDYLNRVVERVLESPPPKDPEQLEEWKKRTAIASQFAAQDEYALYKKALDSPDPRQKIKLLDELQKRNPDSKYLPQALVIYLNSYRAIGDHANAAAYSEKILKVDPSNEDALLWAAEGYLARGGSAEKVLAYSARILDVMRTKKKPAIVQDVDWDKKKTLYIGTAHWMMGNTFITQDRFSQADSALRAALPLLKSNSQSTASILFYLGWANYKMENVTEAARFYKQCMAIQSQFQQQAAKNLNAIRTEHNLPE